MPGAELLRAAEAVLQVFIRDGNRKNVKHARIKFLIDDLGEEEFKKRVYAEYALLKAHVRATLFHLPDTLRPTFPASPTNVEIPKRDDAAYQKFVKNNVELQKKGQEGYYTVSIMTPVGDVTLAQFKGITEILKNHREGLIYVNIHHNLALRWVKGSEIPALYDKLKAIDLHLGEFHQVADITACPGKPTCGLAYTDSHTMGHELYEHIMTKIEKYDAVGDFSIRINGCPNSCAQHYTADIGLQGCERAVGGEKLAHYMFYFGGDLQNDVRFAEREKERIVHDKVPAAVDLILEKYVRERQPNERFKFFVERANKRAEIQEILGQFATERETDELVSANANADG